jgi:hypothetical protein
MAKRPKVGECDFLIAQLKRNNASRRTRDTNKFGKGRLIDRDFTRRCETEGGLIEAGQPVRLAADHGDAAEPLHGAHGV